MSSTQGLESSGSGMPRDATIKNDKKTKRHMTPMEEDVLLVCMKQVIVGGWKSDNGFRPGYLTKVEELMKTKLPGTDLKATPNIHSKIQTWKKNYNSLSAILSLSGVGFNDHMIECTTEQWEHIIKVDANAKTLRNRKWPMYEAWQEIFGKDRATGEGAEDVLDAVNHIFNMEDKGVLETADAYHVNLEHLDDNNGADDSACGSANGTGKGSVCGGERGEAVSKTKGKKRKQNASPTTVVEVLREISRNTDKHLEHIAQRIGYEYDLDAAKMAAFNLLDNIPGLALNDKFLLCEIFTRNTDRLLIYKGLPDSVRPQYLERLLKSPPE